MSHPFGDIAFTPAVRAIQESRGVHTRTPGPRARLDGRGMPLTRAEAEFISQRDGFYQATVGETGWPYVQFRGGPAGFLRALDEHTIAYADFRGNRQYISAGNLSADGRIALILMDYANRRRLKILGRARLVHASDDAGLLSRLEVPSYRARLERSVVIAVEAYDWNCPQQITPRYTEEEFAARF